MRSIKNSILASLAAASILFSVPALSEDLSLTRARLNLAWDSLDQKRYEEALSYIPEDDSIGVLSEEILAIRFECYTRMKRFSEALSLVNRSSFADEDLKYQYNSELAALWVHDAMGRGDYTEAKRAIAELGGHLESDEWFPVFREEVNFRESIFSFLKSGGKEGTLPYGCKIKIVPQGEPRGENWRAVSPGDPAYASISRVSVGEWLPGAYGPERGSELRIWCDKGSFISTLESRARMSGILYDSKKDEFVLRGSPGKTEERVRAGADSWFARAAVEGLGPLGAAMECVGEAVGALAVRRSADEWIGAHRGPVKFERRGDELIAYNPSTGRKAVLETSLLSGLAGGDGSEWADTWRELREELGKASKPLKCFCGRDVALRESLSKEVPRGVLSREVRGGYFLSLGASCPKHLFPVTGDIAGEWGMTKDELFARAQSSPVSKPVDVYFQRVGEGAGERLLFAGEGAGSLPAFPERLLALLEAVDGSGYRESEVSVYAPTESALLVRRSPNAPFESADVYRVTEFSRKLRSSGASLGIRSTVKLPKKGQGSFSLRKME